MAGPKPSGAGSTGATAPAQRWRKAAPLLLVVFLAGCATGGFESLGYSYDIEDDRAQERLAVRPSLSSYAGRTFGNSEAEKEQEYKRLFRIAAEEFFQRSKRSCEVVGEGREISRGGWAFDYEC